MITTTIEEPSRFSEPDYTVIADAIAAARQDVADLGGGLSPDAVLALVAVRLSSVFSRDNAYFRFGDFVDRASQRELVSA